MLEELLELTQFREIKKALRRGLVLIITLGRSQLKYSFKVTSCQAESLHFIQELY